MSSLTIQPIGTRQSIWGEGPLWWQNRLLYVDIEGHSIVVWDPVSNIELVYSVGERVGMVTPASHGNWIFAGDNGIAHFNPITGEKRVLADPEAAKRPHNRFNDGKCDPQGRLWAGTISTIKQTGDAALYRFDPKAGCQAMLTGLTNSNGLCWSPCGSIMYHIDTPTKQVRAYDFDGKTGSISNQRVVVDTDKLKLEGSPDGMTIDQQGHLWIALCHGGAVFCVNPARGDEILELIEFPTIETTSCCFGGEGWDQLYVTTGKAPKDKPSNALDGYVFVVSGLAVKGIPTVPLG